MRNDRGHRFGLGSPLTNYSRVAPVVLCNFMILLSQSTSWTFRRMHKKIANLLGKFSDLNPLIPKIRIINQQLLSEKDNLWPDLTWPDFDKFCGRASFFPLFSFFLLWKFYKGVRLKFSGGRGRGWWHLQNPLSLRTTFVYTHPLF